MFRLRALAVVIAASAATMGFALTAGASSALAAPANPTTLCTQALNPCPTADQYPAGQVFDASLAGDTGAVLSTNLDTVTCDTSEAVLQTGGSQTGTPLSGQINDLTFDDCTDSAGLSCDNPTVTGLPYPVTVDADGGPGNGSLVVDPAGGNVMVHVVCLSGLIDCTFTAPAGGIPSSFTGGSPALIAFDGATLDEASGGIACPSTATFSAEYETTNPVPVWVEAPGS